MKLISVVLATLIAGSIISACAAEKKSSEQMNIVLIFTDDAGYADFGFNGSKEIRTPNLDQLAKESMRFSQAYVSDPTCGPSRAGLITGKYQQRFGFEENNVPGFMSAVSAADGVHMGVPVEEKTMGDYLQAQGYTTGFFGKWHLGGADKFHPTKRGFDTFYGFRGGARSYFAYTKENKPAIDLDYMERDFGKYGEHKGYLTDVLADETVDFIEKANKAKQPFFAFVSFNAPHTPMEATEEDLAQFPNLEGDRKIYAAMMLAMDRASGKIFDKLEALGIEDNTLVVFTNDNGGPTDKNASVNRPLSGTKSNHLEGGLRVPYLVKWPGKLKANSKYDFPVSTLDLLPTFYAAAGGDARTLEDLDGVDLTPYITGKNAARPHEILYWKKDTRATIRQGDWKLIRFPDRPAKLFYISADDVGEYVDLAAKEPERVKQMYKTLFEWELTLERPRWMLKKAYEKYDIDRMDRYW